MYIQFCLSVFDLLALLFDVLLNSGFVILIGSVLVWGAAVSLQP